MAAMVVGPISARITGAAAIVLYGSLVVEPRARLDPAARRSVAGRLSAAAGRARLCGPAQRARAAARHAARGQPVRAPADRGRPLRLAEASAATLARLNDDIVRSLSSGLLSTDLDGRIRTINPTGVEMLGDRRRRADRRAASPSCSSIDMRLRRSASRRRARRRARRGHAPSAATARASRSATRSAGWSTSTAPRSARWCCSRT